MWPSLGTLHSKQWLCNVVLLMGLEGKTGGGDGFKCKRKLCADIQSESNSVKFNRTVGGV